MASKFILLLWICCKFRKVISQGSIKNLNRLCIRLLWGVLFLEKNLKKWGWKNVNLRMLGLKRKEGAFICRKGSLLKWLIVVFRIIMLRRKGGYCMEMILKMWIFRAVDLRIMEQFCSRVWKIGILWWNLLGGLWGLGSVIILNWMVLILLIVRLFIKGELFIWKKLRIFKWKIVFLAIIWFIWINNRINFRN